MSREIKKTNMKKRFTFLMIFAMGTGCLFAQKGFNVQVAIQPGASFLTGEWQMQTHPSTGDYNTMKKSFTFGFEGGVNGGYNFTDNLGVSIGMFYSMQGQNYKGLSVTVPYGTNTLTQDIKLSYLKIPFRFNFNTDPKKSISFTGFAGFYLGFLTGYKQTNEWVSSDSHNDPATVVMKGKTITYTQGGTEQYDLVGKPFKSTNFGMTLGAGVQKKLSEKLFLQLMLNYQLGFGDIKNVSSQIRFSDTELHNVYESDNPNRSVSHKNSALGLVIGLKKSF